MPYGERQWPDLEWVTDGLGEGTAQMEFGTFSRVMTEPDVYDAFFDCACCGQRVTVATGVSSATAYRACVDRYHLIMTRAAGVFS
jgi:hypothetical protein